MKEETQVKIKINDYNKFEKEIISKGAIFVKSGYEKTVRYDDESGSFEEEGKFIRVKTGFNNTLTLKIKSEKDSINSIFRRDIYELEISNIECIHKILQNMRLKPVLIMEKYRMVWNLDGVEIHIDELPFGIYLEIIGEKSKIEYILKKLELSNDSVINGTYWDIYETYKEDFENNKNIVFSRDYICKLAVV